MYVNTSSICCFVMDAFSVTNTQSGALESPAMSPEKKKVDLDRNYSDETFYTDSSEDARSKSKSAATLLQKKRQLRPINGSGNPYRSSTRLTLTSSSRNNVSLVTQKIMSAKLLRVKQLQNELTDAQFQLNELSTENRILRTLQKRQDMALKKYEGTQAELPQLLRSHNEEVRALKTKLKQAKNQNRELENNLKLRETELSALQEQHKHLIKLSKSKHLGEREQLQQQLEQMQELLKEQDKKVQMLTRKLMLETKNYKHQLSSECARHKRTTRELDMALDRIAQLESVLVAKEKYIAVNLARGHANVPSSAMSLGPPPRFQLFQPQTQSAVARISGQRNFSSERVSIERRDNDSSDRNGNDETDISSQLDKKNNKDQSDSSQSQNLSDQKSFGRIHARDDHEGEDEDEADTDEDYQQYMLSESTELQSYSSQITASKSTENVSKDFKDAPKDADLKKTSSSSNFRSSSEANRQISFLQRPEETIDREVKSSKKRNPLRRYSVSGDSELITTDQLAKSSRRGSLNGAGDSGSTSSGKNVHKKTSATQNSEASLDFTCSENAKRNYTAGNNIEATNVTANSLEIPQPDMTAEERQQHLKAINCAWNEIQNRIRDETIRTQSVIDKYDEEQRHVDKQIGKKAIMPESYDKDNLLAALRAIEGGADPVDLNENKEKDTFLPICVPNNTEYGNGSQTMGIPTRSSNSVPSFEKLPQDNLLWLENESIISKNFIHSDVDTSKTKSEVMREILGHHK